MHVKYLRALTLLSVIVSSSLPALSMADEPQTSSAHADILVKSDTSWNGIAYKAYSTNRPELTVLKMTIPAHTALPWHVHVNPNAGYVLKGELTIQDKESGKSQTFKEGQAFAESVNNVHRGVSGDTETVLILTYAGSKSEPTFIAEPGQAPEY